MIFDTNILNYLSKYVLTPEKILIDNPSFSIVTNIEALGFHFKNIEEYELLLAVCDELNIVQLTDELRTQLST